MATITLAANANLSALTFASGDTINLDGYQLTLDINPVQTGVTVNTPGKAGTVLLGAPTVFDLVGWTFVAGTTTLIAIISSDKTFGGSIIGGSANNAHGVSSNLGVVTGNVTGGSGNNAYGINSSSGSVAANVTGGTGTFAYGINNHSGTVTGNVTGGPGAGTYASGVQLNNGVITGVVQGGTANNCNGVGGNNNSIVGNVIGGSAANAFGIENNNGTVQGTVTGGGHSSGHGINNQGGIVTGLVKGSVSATASGCNNLSGVCLGGLQDSAGQAINTWRGKVGLIDGPLSEVSIPSSVSTLYTLFGEVSDDATIPGTTTVIALYTGIPRIPRITSPYLAGGSV